VNTDYTENLIAKLCSQPRSLDFITMHLRGVDPMTALKFLKEMEKKEVIRYDQINDLWLLEKIARKPIGDLLNPNPELYLKKYMADFDFFKKPHPLDFEWRNTKKSVNYLSDLVTNESAVDDNILILGMPTLFASLCRKDIPQQVTILERNKGVLESLKELSHKSCLVQEADVFKFDPSTLGTFSTVVMDPPWYEPHFFQFIWVASRCLRVGGRLIISIPPINTRPGIGAERVKWLNFAEKQGLCLYNLYSEKLEYAMPFFEWNSARIAGVDVNPFWRRGDVAIFQKLEHSIIERPDYTEQESGWREIDIEGCRFRVKVDGTDDENISDTVEFQELVPNQILNTVSSREPIRAQANIWTSGNRIFKTNKPRSVFQVLQLAKESIEVKTSEEIAIFDFIKVISRFEHEEYNQYLEWFYQYLESETN
jgi:hypothetical protein